MKEDFGRQASESPIKRTFYEAKQTLMEYENSGAAGTGTPPVELRYSANNGHMASHQLDYQPNAPDGRMAFLEADETPYENYQQTSNEMSHLGVRAPTHQIRSTESFLNDSSPEYFHPEEYIRAMKKDRTRRRRSKEMIEAEQIVSSNDDEPKRKPETMRSISEDSGNKPAKPVTRRSLSHPEREKEVRECGFNCGHRGVCGQSDL